MDSCAKIAKDLEALLAEEKAHEALAHAEKYALPCLEELKESNPINDYHLLLLQVAIASYYCQDYRMAEKFLSELDNTELSESSFDYVFVEFLRLNKSGLYKKGRNFVIRKAKHKHWALDQYYAFQYMIGFAYSEEGNNSQALDFLEDANRYFETKKVSLFKGFTLYVLGWIAFVRGLYDVAETYVSRSMDVFTEINRIYQVGAAYNLLGIISYRIGRYSKAREYLQHSLRLYRQLHHRIGIINATIGYARTFLYVGEYSRALELLERTYYDSRDIGHLRGVSISAESLGLIYLKLNEYRKASRYIKESAQIALRIAPHGDLANTAFRLMGDIYLAQGQLEKAELALRRALDISISLGARYELGSVLRSQGLLAASKNDPALAVAYFKESFNVLKVLNNSFEFAATCRIATEYYESIYNSKNISEELKSQLFQKVNEYTNQISVVDSTDTNGLQNTTFSNSWLHGGIIVGRSRNILESVNKVRILAPSSIPVLIHGETGTGKELVARLFHKLSLRSKGPFVPVNCASIPDTVFESELFGHRKGSFTGAVSDKRGLMEAAEGGTLFLDEISELSNQQQAKLLRALQEGAVRRIGETAERSIDVRVISASNEDIDSLVAAGRIRKDFYYRICVETIKLEPLRKRKEDIPALVAYYLDGDGKSFEIEDGVFELLDRYNWQGNVRELVGIVKMLKLTAEGKGIIRICDLPVRIRDGGVLEQGAAHVDRSRVIVPQDPINSPDADEGIAQKLILSSLKKHGGNKSAAARELGISRGTLYRRMRELDIN